MSSRPTTQFWAVLGTWVCCGLPLVAATHQVGPGKAYTNLQAVAALLKPGDVVELAGGTTYAGDVRFNVSGTKEAPITIRGVSVNGRRPVVAGVAGADAAVVRISGDYYLLEHLEVTAGGDTNATRGIRNVGHGTIIRDAAVYDCPRFGILNSDAAGSLTLTRVEVYRCGHDEPYHQIYIGMDTQKYPDAVFRLEFSHVHDGNGGNNVKSRAGRNEIYYNWLEGAMGRELELLGPDRRGQPMNKAAQKRVDSDVVGNLMHKSRGGLVTVIRVGGDGSGTSHGRNRFVNNTILMNPKFRAAGIFKLQDDFETLEIHNNVIYAFGEPVRVCYDPGLRYQSIGSHNWLPRGSTHIPADWQGTIQGLNPGFRDLAAKDFHPAGASELRGAGALPTASPPGFDFPQPLRAPLFEPNRLTPSAPVPRPAKAPVDIGAFGAKGSD